MTEDEPGEQREVKETTSERGHSFSESLLYADMLRDPDCRFLKMSLLGTYESGRVKIRLEILHETEREPRRVG